MSQVTQEEHQPLTEPGEFRSLKRRWYIILIFGCLGTLQASIWDGFATISDASFYAYPDWDDSTIALLGNWGEICYLIGVVPFTWLINTKGIRIAAIACGLLVAVGTGIRCLQVFLLKRKNAGLLFKVLCHLGGILNGTAGVAACVIPSVISALWFPPGQRTTSTGIAWVMLELGNALGFLMGPLIVPDPPPHNYTSGLESNYQNQSLHLEKHMDRYLMREDIMYLMYLHFGAAMIILICIASYFPARPPVAPSPTSQNQRADFRNGCITLLKNKSALLLVIAYSISQGIQEALMPVLGLDISPLGIKEDTIGWLGFWSAIASCGAALIMAHLADRLIGKFKLVLLLLLSLASLCFIWFWLLCSKTIPFSLGQLYGSVLLGFASNYACTPLFFELGAEISYPVGEEVVAGLMTCVWTIVGVIFLSVFFIKNIGYVWMNWCLVCSTVACIPLVLFIKEEYRRTEADEIENPDVSEDHDVTQQA